MSHAKLMKLEADYKDVKHSLKACDNDNDYYQLADFLEGLAHDIEMIRENIPQPPHPCRRVNILGHRLDSKGRRIKLSNGKYAR